MGDDPLLRDLLHDLLRADDLRARHPHLFERAAVLRASRPRPPSGSTNPTQTRIARRSTDQLARVVARVRSD